MKNSRIRVVVGMLFLVVALTGARSESPTGSRSGTVGSPENGASGQDQGIPAAPQGGSSPATAALEDPSIALRLLRDDLGALSIGIALCLALLFHIVHLLGTLGTRKRIAELAHGMERVKQLVLAGNSSGAEATALAGQWKQQSQAVQQLTELIKEMDERLRRAEQNNAAASEAVVKVSEWIGESEVRQSLPAEGSQADETSDGALLLAVERSKNALDANAARVGPLRAAMSASALRFRNNRTLPPDLTSRAQSLQTGIEEFDRWQREAEELISVLQRGSWKERQSQLRAEHRRLADQLDARQISIAEHVDRYRELLDHYVTSASGGGRGAAVPADYETELKRRTAGAAEYLMDWFDNFYQLLAQAQSLAQLQNGSIDTETWNALLRIQKVAREVLGKFDVQVEEIQVGHTAYDRRLHEAALIRQSAQVPANTVIGVQRCGFRRMSTGEVLRRPQVVVAGASAG